MGPVLEIAMDQGVKEYLKINGMIIQLKLLRGPIVQDENVISVFWSTLARKKAP